MLEVKEAVQAARKFAEEMYAEEERRHLRLEEIELSEDGKTWQITLGWIEPAVRDNSLLGLSVSALERLPRVYKVFSINAETGELVSMKIREPQAR